MSIPLSVLDLLTQEWFIKTSAALSLGTVVAALVLPRRVPRARESAATAGISLFWLLVPSAVGIALLIATDRPGNPAAPIVALTTVAAQLALTAVVLYRHRRWPWIAIPFALLPWLWWAVLAAAIAWAGMGG